MNFLVTFLTGLIEPILQSLLEKMQISARLNALEAKQTNLIKAMAEVNSAVTSDQKKAAIEALAKADNS